MVLGRRRLTGTISVVVGRPIPRKTYCGLGVVFLRYKRDYCFRNRLKVAFVFELE